MATITRTYLVDDLDGSNGGDVETIQFSLDRTFYEIDLSAANAANFRDKLARFVDNATSSRPLKAVVKPRGRRMAASAPVGDQAQAVRDWARQQGYEVSARGRISRAIQDAFDAAH